MWKEYVNGSACIAVDDILTMLRGEGARISHLRNPTVYETLDQGDGVLNDDALWAALPPTIRIWGKDELRVMLRRTLDKCR